MQFSDIKLTQWSYGVIGLSQHWLRWWLVAWQHRAITWITVNLTPRVLYKIRTRTLSEELLMNLIRNIFSGFTRLELLPHLPGANELMLTERLIRTLTVIAPHTRAPQWYTY